MFLRQFMIVLLFVVGGLSQAAAVEGSTAAGPLGGTDMRAAQLPPPGLYGAVVYAFADIENFYDGNGNAVPALSDLSHQSNIAAGALLYVPSVKVFGGSIGFAGVVKASRECGRIFRITGRRCMTGAGDPYVEFDWSRFFGTVRPSRYVGALPIAEGLTVQLGIGAVIPVGRYSAGQSATYGVSNGDNVWDIAPVAAFTYMTPAIIGEGTEFSAKLYWNNYFKNPTTDYKTGDLVSIDFAITERIGQFQFGLAGLYAQQTEDDRQFGVSVAPGGRRARALSLGFVGSYDMPKYGSTIKIKALTGVVRENVVQSLGASIAIVKKLY